jgi:Flp pilus assembly protein TadD
MSFTPLPPSATNHNRHADRTDLLVNMSHTNGHHNCVATLALPELANDESAFALLIETAESVGRFDLAEEFRKRARQSKQPVSARKPAPTPAERAAASKCSKEGLRLMRAGKLTEATAKFREAIALDPDIHDAHANLGVAYGRTGKRQEAEQCFREAIRLFPQHAPDYGNLCNSCLDQGKLAEAEEAIPKRSN